jgi:hypothetical protein
MQSNNSYGLRICLFNDTLCSWSLYSVGRDGRSKCASKSFKGSYYQSLSVQFQPYGQNRISAYHQHLLSTYCHFSWINLGILQNAYELYKILRKIRKKFSECTHLALRLQLSTTHKASIRGLLNECLSVRFRPLVSKALWVRYDK